MMTKARLLHTLGEIAAERTQDNDDEKARCRAEAALLDYLGDPEIVAAYHATTDNRVV